MPKRIQLRRTAGWHKPDGTIVVARPTKWGNPYRWSDYQSYAYDCDGEQFAVSTESRRRHAVTDFEAAVRLSIGVVDYPSCDEIRRELAGKNLACWCPLDGPCHADVLLKIANGGRDV